MTNLSVLRLSQTMVFPLQKEIELEDGFENMGAQIIKEVASKTNDIAGDNFHSSNRYTQAMVHEGMRRTWQQERTRSSLEKE